MTPEELYKVRLACYEDPVLYARTFKAEAFRAPMSWVHRGILALLLQRADFLLKFGPEQWPDSSWDWTEDQLEKIVKYFTYKNKPLFHVHRNAEGAIFAISLVSSRYTALMLPRGVGKTSIVNLAIEISIVYQDVNFIVYASETATHSEQQLRNVQRELVDNDKIVEVFGDLKPEHGSGKKWRDDFFETTTGITVAAVGRGGQVRGKNVNFKRPDWIVVDDVEDKESISTPEQLKKTKDWYFSDVVPALPQMGGGGKLTFIGRLTVLGTMLSPEALLAGLVDDPEYVAAVFGALDPEGEPIAPFYMSKEQYETRRNSYARRGMLFEFNLEFASTANIDPKLKKFDISRIKYRIMKREDFAGVAMCIDPAISEKQDAAFSSISVVGMQPGGHLHVLDVWAEQGAHPGTQIEQFFRLHFLWSPTAWGVETIAYQAALQHFLQEEMFRQSQVFGSRAYFEITKITHGRTRKYDRIAGILAPRYRAGYISHQAHFPELEVQLDVFGTPGSKVDVPDSLAMAIALLDPLAAHAAGEDKPGADGTEGGPAFVKDHYKPLEDVLGKDWRFAA